jgi:S-adenosylmethionine hydrolase
MTHRPVITLLTDFGLSDHYVAAMKGVILGICPDAQLVDISHEIKAFGVREAAYTLAQAAPCFPAGTVHLIVVDPGVGSSRRKVIGEAGGHCFVAPDNGVLTGVKGGDPAARFIEIRNEAFFRHPVSRTFHGRDIFAPTAAHLARGIAPSEFGPPVADPVLLPIREPVQDSHGNWTGEILHVDRYGNLITNLTGRPREPFELLIRGQAITSFHTHFAAAPTGEPFAIEGSSGYLEVSVNQGDASRLTGASAGDPVTLRFL